MREVRLMACGRSRGAESARPEPSRDEGNASAVRRMLSAGKR